MKLLPLTGWRRRFFPAAGGGFLLGLRLVSGEGNFGRSAALGYSGWQCGLGTARTVAAPVTASCAARSLWPATASQGARQQALALGEPLGPAGVSAAWLGLPACAAPLVASGVAPPAAPAWPAHRMELLVRVNRELAAALLRAPHRGGLRVADMWHVGTRRTCSVHISVEEDPTAPCE
jgi:hypothetical protein